MHLTALDVSRDILLLHIGGVLNRIRPFILHINALFVGVRPHTALRSLGKSAQKVGSCGAHSFANFF